MPDGVLHIVRLGEKDGGVTVDPDDAVAALLNELSKAEPSDAPSID